MRVAAIQFQLETDLAAAQEETERLVLSQLAAEAIEEERIALEVEQEKLVRERERKQTEQQAQIIYIDASNMTIDTSEMENPDDRWFTNESAFAFAIVFGIVLCCCGTCGIWMLQRWNKKYQESREKKTAEAI